MRARRVSLRLFGTETYLGRRFTKYYQHESTYFDVHSIESDYDSHFASKRNGATTLYLSHPSRRTQDSPGDYLEKSVVSLYRQALQEMHIGVNHFIFTGTYWQEPKGNGYEASSLYATTKHLGQEILRCLASKSFKVSVLHLFDVFGDDDHRNKLISKIYSRKLPQESSIELNKPGNLMCPIWAEDVIRGIEIVDDDARNHRSENFKIYALPGPEVIQVSELLERAGYAWHSKQGVKTLPPEIIPKTRHASPPNWAPSRRIFN